MDDKKKYFDNFETRLKEVLKKDIDSEYKHILIRLYDAYKQSYNSSEPMYNLLQMETSYKRVSKAMDNLYNKNKLNTKFNDKDFVSDKFINDKNIKTFDNNFNTSLDSKDYSNINNYKSNIEYYNNTEFLSYLFEHYIMLSDCMSNYDEKENEIRKRTALLLTEMEALLKLSITYPSQIKPCIDDVTKRINLVKKA